MKLRTNDVGRLNVLKSAGVVHLFPVSDFGPEVELETESSF